MDLSRIILLLVSVTLIIEGLVRINPTWNTKFTKWWHSYTWGLIVKTTPAYQKKSTSYGIMLLFLGLAILLLKVI